MGPGGKIPSMTPSDLFIISRGLISFRSGLTKELAVYWSRADGATYPQPQVEDLTPGRVASFFLIRNTVRATRRRETVQVLMVCKVTMNGITAPLACSPPAGILPPGPLVNNRSPARPVGGRKWEADRWRRSGPR